MALKGRPSKHETQENNPSLMQQQGVQVGGSDEHVARSKGRRCWLSPWTHGNKAPRLDPSLPGTGSGGGVWPHL